jgi:HSP20 family protein
MATKQTDAATASTSQNEQGQERQSREQSQGGQQNQASQQGQAQRDARGREGQTGQDNRLARPDLSSAFMSPFTLLQRFFSDDVGSLFEQFGGRRGGMMPQARGSNRDVTSWVPKVDVVQRGNELVVRADLPGVKPEDVTVEVSDDAITISGERQDEHAEERGDIYRFERTYGAFLREIPLPEGAMVDQAKASFRDGVLEITVPAPPEQVLRGRRLEISQGDQASKSDANKEGAQKEVGR